MPTYTFKCPACGNIMEQLMSMGEYASTPLPKCCAPDCDGNHEMKPQITGGTGFVLKGTGWTPKSEHSFGAPTELAMPKKRR